MTRSSQAVFGATVICLVNDSVYGQVSGMRYTNVTAYNDATGVDVPFSLEAMPTRIGVTFELNLIRAIDDRGATAAGLTVAQDSIANMKYFTVKLKDRRSGSAIFTAQYCVCTAESWEVSAKSLMVGSVTCRGLFSSTGTR